MPKVVFTHPVTDVEHWASAKSQSERVELFSPFVSNLEAYTPTDGSNIVALTMDVHDMDGLGSMLSTPEADAAKQAHGVLEPISMFVHSG